MHKCPRFTGAILAYKGVGTSRGATMQRPFFLIAATTLALTAGTMAGTDAFAGRRLSVGMAAGYEVPPGYVAVPVFNRITGFAWTPADTSLGYAFREPIYSTPKGYRYNYVGGYTLRRIANDERPVAKRVYVKKTATKIRRHRGACVTDIGYGRHEYCN
jgi:hypothetical protein